MTVIPLLPCASIDDILTFYTALGFERTHRQAKPNPYLAMRRGDIELHFFGMPGFDPADSYGSCIIQVPDTGELHSAFADGLRAQYGKVPLAGIPRMPRPRPRKNAEGLAGFTVIDPGGNWIRIFPAPAPAAAPAESPAPEGKLGQAGKLAQALDNAVVLSDSHGDTAQAAKILDGALARFADECCGAGRGDCLPRRTRTDAAGSGQGGHAARGTGRDTTQPGRPRAPGRNPCGRRGAAGRITDPVLSPGRPTAEPPAVVRSRWSSA